MYRFNKFVTLVLFALFTFFGVLIAAENFEIREDVDFLEGVLGRRRQLHAKAELLRFLDFDGNTEFHLNFKIPNNELQFIPDQQGFIANLEIKYDFYLEDALVSENGFAKSTIASSVAITQSTNYYVLDKIDFTLGQHGYTLYFEIQDKNASTIFSQRYDLRLLDPDAFISDIEISHGISTELNSALERFQRGQYQFYVDPIPVIDGNNRDFITFFQVTNVAAGADSLYRFYEFIKIKHRDEIVWEYENYHTMEFMPYPIVRRIPLGEYEPGLYTLEITIQDPRTQEKTTIERYFSISRAFAHYFQRVFPDDEEEFELISYFLNSRQRRLWRDLSEEGRKNFIERFWVANNPNVATNNNQFLETIRHRVNDANWRFSYHRAGWKTDMGRIYIKQGNPDDIERRETDSMARYSKKPYQIWKYNSSDKIFVFLDFQGNGNFRLVYVRNDDSENTDPGWKGYFGDDFEEASFRN